MRNHRTLVLGLILILAGCGSTGPERLVQARGTVVAAADGAGYTAGQALDGVQVTLRYQPPLEPSSTIRDTDTSDAVGAWAVETGPPRGQADPNCSTLTVTFVKSGFRTVTERLSDYCGVGAASVEIDVELTPS